MQEDQVVRSAPRSNGADEMGMPDRLWAGPPSQRHISLRSRGPSLRRRLQASEAPNGQAPHVLCTWSRPGHGTSHRRLLASCVRRPDTARSARMRTTGGAWQAKELSPLVKDAPWPGGAETMRAPLFNPDSEGVRRQASVFLIDLACALEDSYLSDNPTAWYAAPNTHVAQRGR